MPSRLEGLPIISYYSVEYNLEQKGCWLYKSKKVSWCASGWIGGRQLFGPLFYISVHSEVITVCKDPGYIDSISQIQTLGDMPVLLDRSLSRGTLPHVEHFAVTPKFGSSLTYTYTL